MKYTMIFDRKRWWNLSFNQLKDEWWMIIVSVIICIYFSKFYSLFQLSFNKLNSLNSDLFSKEQSLDVYYPSLIASLILYIFISSSKYNDKIRIPFFYTIPISGLEKLGSDFFQIGVALPIFHFLAHNFYQYINYNSSLATLGYIEPVYFDSNWMIGYVKAIGLCFPIVSIFRIVDKRILWLTPVLLFLYSLGKIFLPLFNITRTRSFELPKKIYETPDTNSGILIPMFLLAIGIMMHLLLNHERQLK